MPHGKGNVSNPTEQQALKNTKCLGNILMIEQTCKEADSAIWKYLLMNVTEGTVYEHMNPPCGRRQFYESRRKFFYILDLKLP